MCGSNGVKPNYSILKMLRDLNGMKSMNELLGFKCKAY